MYQNRKMLKVVAIFTAISLLAVTTYYRYHTPPLCTRVCSLYLKKLADTLKAQEAQKPLLAPEKLEGKLVTLRKFSLSDFDRYQELLSQANLLESFFVGVDEEKNGFDSHYYLYHQLIEQHFNQRFVYSVIDNKTGIVGGMIEFIPQKHATRGHLAGWASKEYWGSGTAQETVNLALNAFFSSSDQSEIMAHVATHNHRSQAFLLGYGFRLVNKSVAPDNSSDLVFSIEKEEFFNQSSRIAKNANHGYYKA